MTKQTDRLKLNNDVNAFLINVIVQITLTLFDYTKDIDVTIPMTSRKGLQLLKKLTDIQYLLFRLRRYEQINQTFEVDNDHFVTSLYSQKGDTMQINIDLKDDKELVKLANMITSLTIVQIKNV
ncbi:hypothetical protein ACNAN0_02135 [Agrilactobacillus fermenti]|uniref:hypothetical protein n=1 Tax=Agrilactobacillus fermenti TaxID=2586909 RepID=UPI003A5C4F09